MCLGVFVGKLSIRDRAELSATASNTMQASLERILSLKLEHDIASGTHLKSLEIAMGKELLAVRREALEEAWHVVHDYKPLPEFNSDCHVRVTNICREIRALKEAKDA